MESYIVRIYRRDAQKVAGLLIETSSGEKYSFQNLQQLGQHLDLGKPSTQLEHPSRQNLKSTETFQQENKEEDNS